MARHAPHDIASIVAGIDRLNPIPAAIHKIIASLGDPDCPLSEIVRIVEHDPAITANLLKICNSAHFGLVGKIGSVQHAITLLGVDRVAELVMLYGMPDNLQAALNGYCLEKGQLWKQSVAAAMLARTLAQRRRLDNQAEIYTAALLKDIGKVVLHEHVGRAIEKIRKRVDRDGISFEEAEKDCLGIDHAALGAMIARRWHFTDKMIFMIEHHHLTLPDARNDPATGTLYWADMVAMMVGTGIGVDRLAYRTYEDSYREFSLTREELKVLMEMYKGYYRGAEHLFDAW